MIKVAKWVIVSDNRGRATRPAAILIAGPTASGKSALALHLARLIGGVVVNADSMQVYRDLRIITARPTEADEALAPHVLYGAVDGATTHSVARWLGDVGDASRHAEEGGLTPILVGGTGLYFKALTQGLSEIPSIPAEVRAAVRRWASTRSPHELHAELARRDPRTAQGLRPTDPQRVTRALEVHVATGEGLATYQAKRSKPLFEAGRYVGFALTLERAILRERVDRRFEAMIRDGALLEVEEYRRRGLDGASPLMRAHGVQPLIRHLAGATDLATAIEEGKADTRRYLKRQDTFFRHQLPDFTTATPAEAEDAILRLARQL